MLVSAMQNPVLHVSAAAATPVPVNVLTVSSVTSKVFDVSFDSNGNVIYVVTQAVYRLATDGSAQLLAGSTNGTTGADDGVGSAATFGGLYGISCDVTHNIAYLADSDSFRVRALEMSTNDVTTLAGSSTSGHLDGNGTYAQFVNPRGIVYHASGVLFIAESVSSIRQIRIDSAEVTTITTAASTSFLSDVFGLCVNRAGTLLYVATSPEILEVNISAGFSYSVAGNYSATGYGDGIAWSALFLHARSVALNSDESALIIVDQHNERIRKLDFATWNVITVAGSGGRGLLDGLASLPRSSTLLAPSGTAMLRLVNAALWWLTFGTTLFALLQLRTCRPQHPRFQFPHQDTHAHEFCIAIGVRSCHEYVRQCLAINDAVTKPHENSLCLANRRQRLRHRDSIKNGFAIMVGETVVVRNYNNRRLQHLVDHSAAHANLRLCVTGRHCNNDPHNRHLVRYVVKHANLRNGDFIEGTETTPDAISVDEHHCQRGRHSDAKSELLERQLRRRPHLVGGGHRVGLGVAHANLRHGDSICGDEHHGQQDRHSDGKSELLERQLRRRPHLVGGGDRVGFGVA
ncbi:Hypothetical protein, putative, partial [Bodo saltans]